MPSEDNESGILVYPQLPVPGRQQRQSRVSTQRDRRGRRSGGAVVAVVVAALAGGAGGWFLQPAIAPDPRIAAATKRAGDAEAAAGLQKTRADGLEKSLDEATRARKDADTKLAVAAAAQGELAGKTADEAGRRKAVEAVQVKLRPVIDRSIGSLAIEGGDVHVRLADRAMFKPNDDALTDRGKAVLSRLAAALKDLPDKQVWVQGHTDDTPVALPRPPPPPAPPPPKGAKAAPPPPAPVVRFPTNWELSAGRALAVVRYFQDVGKLDPSRLAALAFSQYAPLSKKDKSVNRRLEIVIGAKRPENASNAR
jgi:chemotaxis protein MotB